MHSYLLTEALVHDRQRELQRSASRYGRGSRRRSVPAGPLRARAGWFLVRSGLRLARADPRRLEAPVPRLRAT